MKRMCALLAVVVTALVMSACTAQSLPTYVVADGDFKMLGIVDSVVNGRNYTSEFGCEVRSNGEYNVVPGLVFLSPYWDEKATKPYLAGFEYPAAKSASLICPSGAILHLPLDWKPADGIDWLEKKFPDYNWTEDGQSRFNGGLRFSYVR